MSHTYAGERDRELNSRLYSDMTNKLIWYVCVWGEYTWFILDKAHIVWKVLSLTAIGSDFCIQKSGDSKDFNKWKELQRGFSSVHSCSNNQPNLPLELPLSSSSSSLLLLLLLLFIYLWFQFIGHSSQEAKAQSGEKHLNIQYHKLKAKNN